MHKVILRREVNAPVRKAVPYFKSSEYIPSGPVSVAELVEQRSLNTSILENGVISPHSSGTHGNAKSILG